MSNVLGITSANGGQTILSPNGGQFGENEFLKILVTQMQSQTPLNPVDNQSFMNQMASLSNMREQRELNDNLLNLLSFQGLLARLQGLSEGSSLLGKEITYDDGTGNLVTGTAESVFVNNEGDLRITVDGEEISIQQVTGVAQPGSGGGSGS